MSPNKNIERLPVMIEALEESLQDNHMSRRERSTLKELLGELRPSAHEQEQLLYKAFEMVREKMPAVHDRLLGWLEETVKILRPPKGIEVSGARMAEAWFLPEEKGLERLLKLLRGSRRSLDLCIFTVTHNVLTREILDAHQRGVKVRLLTDDEKVDALGSDIERLARRGIPVRTDSSHAHMHHKFLVVDKKIMATGSFNWTRSAAEENWENLLLTDDPLLVNAYMEEFNRLWQAFGLRDQGRKGGSR